MAWGWVSDDCNTLRTPGCLLEYMLSQFSRAEPFGKLSEDEKKKQYVRFARDDKHLCWESCLLEQSEIYRDADH
jgi:hypothetical protein